MSQQEGQMKLPFSRERRKTENGSFHPVLEVPVLYKLFKATMPELLRSTPASIRMLDRIAGYLAHTHTSMRSAALERQLPEEVYTVLCGLKYLLRGRNLNIVEWVLEDSKQRFADWLEEAMEEE